MYKLAYFLLIWTAGVFTTLSPVHAQSPELPPFSGEAGQPPSAQWHPAAGARNFPSAEPLKPIKAESFPYRGRLLRDPFWTVGYYPPQWGAELKPEKQKMSTSEWRIPTSQIEVSGVSRMGERVMAIVNGELKKVNDVVEISYLGKTFQWKVGEIQEGGNVRLDRHQIINESSTNRSTP